MINLQTLQNEFIEFSANQAITSRIADWAFWVLTDMIGENDYPWNKKTNTFATVADTPEYILSHRITGKRIESMFDETNNAEIYEKDLVEFYHLDPTPTEGGNAYHWAFVTHTEVQTITDAAGVIHVSSSSAADVNINLVVRGRVSGIERIEPLTVNGTSTVDGALSFDADGVYGLQLSSYCAGVITVLQGATVIATIPPGFLRVQSPRIRLNYVPSGVATIRYFYYQAPQRPSNLGDIIDLPNEGFRCFRKGIEAISHMNNGDIDFAAQAEQEYEALKQKFYNWSVRSLNKKEIKGYIPNRQGFLGTISHHNLTAVITA